MSTNNLPHIQFNDDLNEVKLELATSELGRK